MSLSLDDLPASVSEFCTERHLATLTTMRPDGSAHVSPVGFSWDGEAKVARVIAGDASQKVVNARRDARVVLCQVDGGRWLSLEGRARVTSDPVEVAEAERRYGSRYQAPRPNPSRVAIIIEVNRVLGRPAL